MTVSFIGGGLSWEKTQDLLQVIDTLYQNSTSVDLELTTLVRNNHWLHRIIIIHYHMIATTVVPYLSEGVIIIHYFSQYLRKVNNIH
jgi:hypothetical protein